MTFVDVEKMIAFPADKNDPSSIWINSPERITSVIDTVLGSNSYKARTGVFTGGANAVYWMNIAERSGETIKISNIVERAKRKVKAVTAEIEPVFVYPLVQGSDISQWKDVYKRQAEGSSGSRRQWFAVVWFCSLDHLLVKNKDRDRTHTAVFALSLDYSLDFDIMGLSQDSI